MKGGCIIAAITSRSVTRCILTHLKLAAAPRPLPRYGWSKRVSSGPLPKPLSLIGVSGTPQSRGASEELDASPPSPPERLNVACWAQVGPSSQPIRGEPGVEPARQYLGMRLKMGFEFLIHSSNGWFATTLTTASVPVLGAKPPTSETFCLYS